MNVVNVGLQRFTLVKTTVTCSVSLHPLSITHAEHLVSLFLSSAADSAVTLHGKDGREGVAIWWVGILDEQAGGRVSQGERRAACFFYVSFEAFSIELEVEKQNDDFSLTFIQVLPQRFLPACFIYDLVQSCLL